MDDIQPMGVENLPRRFFHEARRAALKETSRLVFSSADIQTITRDPALLAEFREIFRSDVNDPAMSELVVDYLEEFAVDLESRAKVSDIKVDLIDRAGIAIAASVTVAAVGSAVVSGGTFGSVLLLAGGLIGLAATGTSRMKLKLYGLGCSVAAERIRRLAGGLKGHKP